MDRHAKPALVLEDLYRLPDDGRRYELTHGRLVSEPPPGGRHGRVAARIVGRIDAFLQINPVGVVLTCDTGFVLRRSPDTVRAPDVAFVTLQRYLALADETLVIPGPPDLAVEVLSPNDRSAAIQAKVADYLTAGTTLVWVVDSDMAEICVYRKPGVPQRLRGADVLTAEDLLPGFSAMVGQLIAPVAG